MRLLLWPAGAALGIAGEAALYGFGDARHSVPDLAAGWSLIACGLVAWSCRPESRSGPLMAAAGAAWFAGNFFSWALYLHRGPLAQLVLTYPSGRTRGRLARAAVAAGYAAAVVPAVWRGERTTIVLSGLLVAVAGYRYASSGASERRRRLAAFAASGYLGVVLAGNAAVRLAWPTAATTSATLLTYEVALCVLAGALLVGLVVRPWEHSRVTDLVVELGEIRSGGLRDALAGALGDPSLEVGFRLPDGGPFVDATGRPVEVPNGDSDRHVTRVEREGRTVAVLVHDPGVLDDPGLLDAVDAAARLAASNARLDGEVRAQLVELQASRRRLLRASDAERRRLEQRLREGAERRLGQLTSVLAGTRADAVGRDHPGTAARVARAQDHLAGTIAELHELAGGLHPRVLTDRGLGPALAALAERSEAPVELVLPAERLPAEVETAAYFVCSEALANIAKYASASRVALTVTTTDGRAVAEITDDGIGGADANRGSGIRGLTDRVEAIGGTLRLESPAGCGTRLRVELPLGGRA